MWSDLVKSLFNCFCLLTRFESAVGGCRAGDRERGKVTVDHSFDSTAESAGNSAVVTVWEGAMIRSAHLSGVPICSSR